MDEEVQQLRDMVAQLKADNERLRQERAVPPADPPPADPPVGPVPIGASDNVTTERFVFVPRDRKCPSFRGNTGIRFDEWEEEVQACMRARHLSSADQAFFLFDHLEGEAREEIKYRSVDERSDPRKIVTILRELYGCSQSHVSLQEAFFSRKQQEGESLLEFSLALMNLMGKIRQVSPQAILNSEIMLRDQFVEYVLDGGLSRTLKQLVWCQLSATLLDVRGEALRWERDGMPSTMRGRSQSVPFAHGIQYGVQGNKHPSPSNPVPNPEMVELKEILKRQQEQLDLLTRSVDLLQTTRPRTRTFQGPIICRRCQEPGHYARDCEGRRAAPRTRTASVSNPSRTPHVGTLSSQVQEN